MGGEKKPTCVSVSLLNVMFVGLFIKELGIASRSHACDCPKDWTIFLYFRTLSCKYFTFFYKRFQTCDLFF